MVTKSLCDTRAHQASFDRRVNQNIEGMRVFMEVGCNLIRNRRRGQRVRMEVKMLGA